MKISKPLKVSLTSLCLLAACGSPQGSNPQKPTTVDSQGHEHELMPIDAFKQGIEIQKLSGEALRFNPGEIAINKPITSVSNSISDTVHVLKPYPILLKDSYSLAGYQTSIRNQGGRGSCWAFAGVAAYEAAYKRAYGVDLDLSEQYLFHIEKSGELYGDYMTNFAVMHENNSSMWGFQGNSGIVDMMIRAAIPEERFAPYKDQWQLNAIPGAAALDWNSSQEALDAMEFSQEHIPTVARHNAKFRPVATASVTDGSLDNLKNIIKSNHEIVADVDLKWRFDAGKNAYVYDPSSGGGGHVFLLVGYDDNDQVMLVKNSWGEPGLIRVAYDFFTNGGYQYGHYITNVGPKDPQVQNEAKWVGVWNMDHDGWRGQLVIRRFTNYRAADKAATKLGNYYRDGKRYDVNGFFEQNGQVVNFWIADNSDRVNPGEQRGQKHTISNFGWDPSKGAGETYWNGTSFGSQLSRDAIPFQGNESFNVYKWIGSWKMNHDGWRGTLTINSVIPAPGMNFVVGTYTAQDGRVFNVAAPALGDGHVINFNIPFAADNNQPFTLMHHTWENGVVSGVTTWAGQRYGVQAYK